MKNPFRRPPIRVVFDEKEQRMYATNQYKVVDGLLHITGRKDDVTNDIAWLVNTRGIRFDINQPKPESNDVQT